jgi:hypothetical protein
VNLPPLAATDAAMKLFMLETCFGVVATDWTMK